ncbi:MULTISPECIES: DJ-1/PfpI family protein [Bizionia]|uniref:Glutamine amidotransferase n=1 Tax=Bizionia algoritergicola TaxID=291187 RepID=A0A5D0QPV7_9FLAO|nr:MULTISPECIES: DJ-1/PfpI family protein [Bizionia]OBX22560.1 glutamine amidotransferase [Bizionia sp. APA-3]TYB70751.1 glutamine amidotransferase [Bizionia algoritergicola]
MTFKNYLCFVFLVSLLCNCNNITDEKVEIRETSNSLEVSSDTLTKHLKPFKKNVPTIGLLMYSGVLQSEVIATSDVFAKASASGDQLFNVITIAETNQAITSEEGMHFVPDYTFENCPKLDALFVPSAYDMYAQVHNKNIIDFIKAKNQETTYTVSNCAGAQLIGKSGIADGHKIVTWIGGGVQLQKDYPNLKVQDDATVTFIEDGKFSSSNGNLASYISALNLLEKMTSLEHRKFVESYLYLDRLQNWKPTK